MPTAMQRHKSEVVHTNKKDCLDGLKIPFFVFDWDDTLSVVAIYKKAAGIPSDEQFTPEHLSSTLLNKALSQQTKHEQPKLKIDSAFFKDPTKYIEEWDGYLARLLKNALATSKNYARTFVRCPLAIVTKLTDNIFKQDLFRWYPQTATLFIDEGNLLWSGNDRKSYWMNPRGYDNLLRTQRYNPEEHPISRINIFLVSNGSEPVKNLVFPFTYAYGRCTGPAGHFIYFGFEPDFVYAQCKYMAGGSPCAGLVRFRGKGFINNAQACMMAFISGADVGIQTNW
eukprot:CAMPEP_0117511318 /NCGR_PEP_ID=MMETSP0784-20121206/28446_1 /TAXON_ID=39447 /ORGANISM="" /LENGTH=282 /DNA_ID=CAMNT_0005306987 /DNA_START=130 /DNA_END=975 /DNA_ORIENTATION=-